MAIPGADVWVSNRCPACGGSMFIGAGGWITCSVIGCKSPSLDEALERARLDIIRASQLEYELAEARREALAMRVERDIEIAKRVTLQAAARDILIANAPELVDLLVPEIKGR